MLERWRQRRVDRRVLIVVAALVAVALVGITAALVGRESEAYKTGRSVGVALFKSGTPKHKCADVRQGAELEGMDTEDERRDFYEGCLAGWEDIADER
jgi:hypothetical protein